MAQSQQIIAGEASSLARELPHALMQIISEIVQSYEPSDWQGLRAKIISEVAHPHYRSLVGNFLDRWKTLATDVSPDSVAIALRTAAHCEKVFQDQQSIELAWTGPEVGVASFRRTEQALAQLIDSARERILIVSYAVYNIPRIRDALIRAAGRSVRIVVILETPDRLEGQNAYSTLQALGSDVAARSSVYYWPLENRMKDNTGRAGILHVKCAAADGRTLFLTSANLTEYAFTLNMELGLLVTGGTLAEQVEQHFQRMIEIGILATP